MLVGVTEAEPVAAQVLEMSDPNMGYNAATNEFTDMVKVGVIDPLKVRDKEAPASAAWGPPVLVLCRCALCGWLADCLGALQVVRTALVDAASVSSLITTSEAVIVEAPEEKKNGAGPAGGYGAGAPDMY